MDDMSFQSLFYNANGESAHPAPHTNFHSSLENIPSVTAERAVGQTFVSRVGGNSSVALKFTSRILHSTVFPASL